MKREKIKVRGETWKQLVKKHGVTGAIELKRKYGYTRGRYLQSVLRVRHGKRRKRLASFGSRRKAVRWHSSKKSWKRHRKNGKAKTAFRRWGYLQIGLYAGIAFLVWKASQLRK